MDVRLSSLQWSKGIIPLVPIRHRSNSWVKNCLKIIKRWLKETAGSNSDPCLALLNYRTSVMKHGWLPTDISFNRRLKKRMPAMLDWHQNHWGFGKRQTRQKQTKQKKPCYGLGLRGCQDLIKIMLCISTKWSQTAMMSQQVVLIIQGYHLL